MPSPRCSLLLQVFPGLFASQELEVGRWSAARSTIRTAYLLLQPAGHAGSVKSMTGRVTPACFKKKPTICDYWAIRVSCGSRQSSLPGAAPPQTAPASTQPLFGLDQPNFMGFLSLTMRPPRPGRISSSTVASNPR